MEVTFDGTCDVLGVEELGDGAAIAVVALIEAVSTDTVSVGSCSA